MRIKSILTIAVVQLFLLSTNLIAQYSNASLNGPWFLHTEPMVGREDSTDFLVFDGAGKIMDGSMHGKVGGYYNVSSMGVLSGKLFIEDDSDSSEVDSFEIGGIFASAGKINMGDYRLTKVENPGALTDTLTGTLNTPDYGSKNVLFVLNYLGYIIYSEGIQGQVSGKVYTQNNVFVGHVRAANGESHWDEFTFTGNYLNDSLIGEVTVDADRNTNRTGPAKLVRNGKATPVGVTKAVSKRSSFNIYPNPAKEVLNIDLYQSAAARVRIADMLGKTCLVKTIDNGTNSMSIEELPAGFYLVTIAIDNSIYTHKLIKE